MIKLLAQENLQLQTEKHPGKCVNREFQRLDVVRFRRSQGGEQRKETHRGAGVVVAGPERRWGSGRASPGRHIQEKARLAVEPPKLPSPSPSPSTARRPRRRLLSRHQKSETGTGAEPSGSGSPSRCGGGGRRRPPSGEPRAAVVADGELSRKKKQNLQGAQ